MGSVLALDHEVRAANGAGQFRLLPRELESLGKLLGDFHAVRELEPDRALRPGLEAVHHVDGQAGCVEHVREPGAPRDERRRLQRLGFDDDVALVLEDAVDPLDGRGRIDDEFEAALPGGNARYFIVDVQY